jgi:predicted alpha/beta superfamily hydrolase
MHRGAAVLHRKLTINTARKQHGPPENLEKHVPGTPARDGDPVLAAAVSLPDQHPCALQHPARLAEFSHHHAQLRVFRELPSSFLPSTRDVTVYLPAGYDEEPSRHYPVLYMHDGQNLFDPQKSFVPGHHWHVAENADAVIDAGQVEPLIIVGVNNTGERRLAEYTHSADPKLGGGEADCYGLLLVEELMPFINETFRTLEGAQHTGLGGSSLGGLVSLYLGLRYPEVFGRLAVMSPSVWWDRRSILRVLKQVGTPSRRARIWLDAGDAEGPRTQPDATMLATQLERQGWAPEQDLHYERVAGGRHDEAAWAARVGPMLRWLFPPAGTPPASRQNKLGDLL